MGLDKPDKDHYSRVMAMIWGVDPIDGKWSPITVDDDGHLYAKGYVKDWETLSWVPGTNLVKVDPMVDIDVTITYTGDKITGIVASGLGKTKTMVVGWTGDQLTSIQASIT